MQNTSTYLSKSIETFLQLFSIAHSLPVLFEPWHGCYCCHVTLWNFMLLFQCQEYSLKNNCTLQYGVPKNWRRQSATLPDNFYKEIIVQTSWLSIYKVNEFIKICTIWTILLGEYKRVWICHNYISIRK